MEKALYKISKMDCPSEEQMIRMKLEPIAGIKSLDFDIPNRSLTIYHTGNTAEITAALESLNFNSILISTEKTENEPISTNNEEKRLLWLVLWINFSFFVIEIVTGFIARSMGLVADSLDMLADAIVYGLSLFAVGKLLSAKKRIAKMSGYFQLILAIVGFIEVIRRFFGFEEVPEFRMMIIVSIFALIANGASLFLLQRSKSQEVHIKASLIFTSNDVLVNLGVILAGIAVYLSDSKYPDLIIGGVVFLIVIRGAFRILKLAK